MAKMPEPETRRTERGGWSLAAALGLLAVAFLWDRLSPPENVARSDKEEPLPRKEAPDRDASAIGLATEGADRGREAESPSEIPAKGWKDILLRVYGNISEHRVLALAAGMTYYSLLAIFPALAALVAIYGLFSDPGSIAKHLDQVSGFIPGGAIDVARDQLTRVASKGNQALGLNFAIGLAVSLWSANAAMKSLFDTLNIVYGEKEKRGFVKLNAASLSFTLAGIVFVLVALGAVVVLPVVLNFVGLSDAADLLIRLARCPHVRRGRIGARAHLSLRPQPRGAALALDHLGQRGCDRAVARRLCVVLMVCRQFRQVQRDLRLARRRDRLHDLALDLSDRDPARSRARRRDGAPDGARHDDWIREADGRAWCEDGRYGGRGPQRLISGPVDTDPPHSGGRTQNGRRRSACGPPAKISIAMKTPAPVLWNTWAIRRAFWIP